MRNDDIRDEEPEVLETKRVAEVQFKQISVGYEFACGIGYASGDLHCWGGAPRLKKLLKKAISGPFKQVSVGKLGACAIRVDDDGLQCFGAPMHSRLDQNPPRAGTKFDQVKVGPLSACAVDLDSQLHCWGGAQPDHEIVVA